MKATLLLYPCAAIGLAAALASAAGPTGIEVRDDFFSPERATAGLGSSPNLDWRWAGGPLPGSTVRPHNVRQDDRLFRSGRPRTSDRFRLSASAGTYRYYCEVHGGPGGAGMSGRVRVRPLAGPAPGRKFRVRWANRASTTGDRYDVDYRIGNRRWRPWKRGARSRSAIFGRRAGPRRVRAGRTYRFRARSKAGSGRRSGWSPKLVVRT